MARFYMPPEPPYVPCSTPLGSPEWDPYGRTVLVLVGHGAEETVFTVNETLIRYYSGWFNTMCNGPYMQNYIAAPQTAGGGGGSGSSNRSREPEVMRPAMRLPGEKPAIFATALDYLVYRVLYPIGSAMPEDPWPFDQIVEFYALGVRRNMPLVQNVAVNTLAGRVKKMRVLPDAWTLEFMWEVTEPGAPIRRLMVDLVREMCIPDYHRHHVWEDLVGGRSLYPEQLAQVCTDYVSAGRKVRVSAKTWRRLESCEWHVHEPGVTCEGSEEARLAQAGYEHRLDRFGRVMEGE